MEEITPLHLQLPAAELPIRTKEEMKLEEFILGRIKIAFADQTEIRYEFFIPSAPDLAAVLPADDREPRLANMFFFLDAIPESGIAEPEYIPQDTVTGRIRTFPATTVTQSNPLALRAGFFR